MTSRIFFFLIGLLVGYIFHEEIGNYLGTLYDKAEEYVEQQIEEKIELKFEQKIDEAITYFDAN